MINMRRLFVEKFTLTTHCHHTEIMRLLYESINRRGLRNAKIEGVTSYKKFEIRKCRSWWSRQENAWAEGVVEDTPEGSVIRVKMVMDLGKLIFLMMVNLIIIIMLIVAIFSNSFDMEVLFVVAGEIVLMFLINGFFRLIFLSEVRDTKRILIQLLHAKESV